MEWMWEPKKETSRPVLALAGAFLGAALGADCFLAVQQLLGIPAFLCGAAIAYFAVTGSGLLSGKRNRAGALMALPFIVLWGLFANHFGFALSAAPVEPSKLWNVLVSLKAVTDSAGTLRYWLQLAGTLDLALTVWVLLFLRAKREEALLEAAVQPPRAEPEPAPMDMEAFFPNQAWIRPFLLQRRISQGIWLAVLSLCGWMWALVGHERVWTLAAAGMLVSLLFLFSFQGPPARICTTRPILYARKDNQLWRVALNQIQDPDLRVPMSKLAQIWDQLPRERKKRFLSVIAEVVSNQTGLNSVVLKLENPQLNWQSKWEWNITVSGGATLFIPKVYPNFTPVPGSAERVKTPTPFRWINPICTVLVTALCLTVGCCIGLQQERSAAEIPSQSSAPPPPVESVLPDPIPSGSTEPEPATMARVPEKIGYYSLNGLSMQTDNEFKASMSDIVDEKNGVEYHLSLQYGVEEEALRAVLEKTEAEQIQYLRPDSDEPLWRMGENSIVYRYNIRTAYLPDGQIAYAGAALSERGTLFLIETTHDGSVSEETILGDILYILENLEFTGPAITGENYQEQLRPAVGMGFNYCGQGFLRAPMGLFGYDAFLDTFLPCGGTLNYYDDGLSVMTSAHGLRVSAAITPSDGTPEETLKAIYQNLKAAGRQYDEQNLYEDAYTETTGCIATVYYDGGRTRATVMYVIRKWDGYYLFKEMTCLPEEIDDEYAATFKEMEASCGISVPHMETIGQFSR